MASAMRLGERGLLVLQTLQDDWLAQHLRVVDGQGRHWRVKILCADAADETQRRRLRREFDLQRQAAGPHILVAQDWLTWSTTQAILMEDIGGRTLDEWLAKQPLDLRSALRVAIDVAVGLDHLHALNMVHKDISPASVLWNPQTGVVKIGNFSLASAQLEEYQQRLGPRTLQGCLPCLAPECTGRLNRLVDARADLYALGALLYWMLAGRPPFQAQDPLGWVQAHLAQVPQPLQQLVPGVPGAVSDIVARLLAKMPEQRYQSAWGVQADLQRCLDAQEAGAAMPELVLGGDDYPTHIRSAGRLYGREAPLQQLQQAFAAVCQGGSRSVMVSGSSGLGKSALVNELRHTIWLAGGRFAEGKVDQFQRHAPYAVLVQALEGLVARLFDDGTLSAASFRAQCLDAAGEDMAFLQVLVPSLAGLARLPAMDLPASLSVAETRLRFYRAATGFLRMCAAQGQPLVLFLDNLQWADSASLQLLEPLLADGNLPFFLCIGAYRDNALDVQHPLWNLLGRLADRGSAPLRLQLGVLDAAAVHSWLADSLQSPSEKSQPLAALVQTQTGGNPFFIQRFLQHAQAQGWLCFDRSTRSWEWQVDLLRSTGLLDNVVDLLFAQMQALDERSQALLATGAVLGTEFELQTVAQLQHLEPEALLAAADRALGLGFICQRQPGHFSFSHDRIQEAASRLLSAEGLRQLHGQIGAHWLATLDAPSRERRLFEIVGHLSAAIDSCSPYAERLHFAQLVVQTARRSRLANAHADGLRCIEQALGCLGPDLWTTEPELAFRLHSEAQANAFLGAAFADAERHYAELEAHSRDPLRLAECRSFMITQKTMQGQYGRAVEVGLKAMVDLGLVIDMHKVLAEIQSTLERYEAHLGKHRH